MAGKIKNKNRERRTGGAWLLEGGSGTYYEFWPASRSTRWWLKKARGRRFASDTRPAASRASAPNNRNHQQQRILCCRPHSTAHRQTKRKMHALCYHERNHKSPNQNEVDIS